MDGQRSATDLLQELKERIDEARAGHIAKATPSAPAILYGAGFEVDGRLLKPSTELSLGEHSRRAEEILDGNHRDQFSFRVNMFVSGVRNDMPDVTLARVVRAIRLAWPAKSGISAVKTLTLWPDLVKETHDALIKDGENSKSAYARISAVAGVGDEVVRKLVQKAKGKKS